MVFNRKQIVIFFKSVGCIGFYANCLAFQIVGLVIIIVSFTDIDLFPECWV